MEERHMETDQNTEKPLRSIMKGISWRVIASVTTIVLVYLFTRSFTLSLEVGAIEVVAKLTFYYLHERAWNKVRWGKVST